MCVFYREKACVLLKMALCCQPGGSLNGPNREEYRWFLFSEASEVQNTNKHSTVIKIHAKYSIHVYKESGIRLERQISLKNSTIKKTFNLKKKLSAEEVQLCIVTSSVTNKN